jgi:hypothetical protein
MEFNLKTPNFTSMFPDLVAEYEENRQKAESERAANGGGSGGGDEGNGGMSRQGQGGGRVQRRKGDEPGLLTLVLCVSAIVAVLAAVLRFSG